MNGDSWEMGRNTASHPWGNSRQFKVECWRGLVLPRSEHTYIHTRTHTHTWTNIHICAREQTKQVNNRAKRWLWRAALCVIPMRYRGCRSRSAVKQWYKSSRSAHSACHGNLSGGSQRPASGSSVLFLSPLIAHRFFLPNLPLHLPHLPYYTACMRAACAEAEGKPCMFLTTHIFLPPPRGSRRVFSFKPPHLDQGPTTWRLGGCGG